MIPILPIRDLQVAKKLVDVMDENSRSILEGKQAAIARGDSAILEQIGRGKDIISLLIRAAEKSSAEDRLSEEELRGQMNVMMFAGTDTTSTAMSRILHELAHHMDVQEQLRKEVTQAAAHGDLEYDVLNKLPLLEAICRETLRLYPPAITASRQATRDTVLPLGIPMTGKDGTTITEVVVPKGTIVHVGIKAANTRCSLWGADALQWKPERWLNPLPSAIADADIPGVYPKLLTFIGGARGCIGYKFAEISIKVQLAILVKGFRFEVSDKKVAWKLGQAEAPTFEGKHMLPMVVSMVSHDA
nr:cytochrome P450 [Mycena chlorophos]